MGNDVPFPRRRRSLPILVPLMFGAWGVAHLDEILGVLMRWGLPW